MVRSNTLPLDAAQWEAAINKGISAMQKSRRLKLGKLFVAAEAKLLEEETSLEDLAYAR